MNSLHHHNCVHCGPKMCSLSLNANHNNNNHQSGQLITSSALTTTSQSILSSSSSSSNSSQPHPDRVMPRPLSHRAQISTYKSLISRHLSSMSLFLLLLLSLSTRSSASSSLSLTTSISSSSVVSRCQANCPQQLNLEDDLDIACNSTCKIEQCEIGCQFWRNQPLSCFDVCQNSSIIDHWVIYCAIGCNHAHTVYVEQVKSIVNTPDAPKLVAHTLSNDSLSVEWSTNSVLPNLTYRVQWKYSNISSTWTYATDVAVAEGRLQLRNLFAYTSYVFRIEWVIVPWLRISIFSRVSQPITTLPYGVPSTPCIITSCLAISANQISVGWQQPHFPNGPIIAYTLYLTDNSSDSSNRIVKDLQMSEQFPSLLNSNEQMNYVFNGLKAETQFTVSIVTFNNFGEGPVCERRIETLESIVKSNDSSSSEEALKEEVDSASSKDEAAQADVYKLFIASTNEVSRRDPEKLFDEEIIYHLTDYTENHEITGMAIHVKKKYLFVSDSSGTVRRVLLKENNQEINQVTRIINGSNNPSHLSMDWLNDKLYLVEDTRISRCNLDGEAIESVVTGFRARPLDMKIDPYNGFLFWLLTDPISTTTALYRVDLADIASGAAKLNYASAQMIFQKKGITTFAVSYFDYRIYFPVTTAKNIYSITIDGKDAETIRDNSNSPDAYVDIENMIIFDRKLYFTNEGRIGWEEYHEEEETHYPGWFNTEATKLVSLLVMDNQSQPYPVPLNLVEKVQAVFLDTSAKISWEKPALFGGSGRGAWQDWRYEVSIEEEETEVLTVKVNNITNCVADELKPDTEYLIKVRAWSVSGKGAWSDMFNGRTLPSLATRGLAPYAIVSTADGLLKTDIGGKFLYQLVGKSEMSSIINGVVWYKDQIVVNTENSVMVYNESAGLTKVGNITNAASLKVEWFAGKLYWSNPFERMICRANLDGSQMEVLPIMTYAKEIAIDSKNGFLYWSTMYSIKYSLLNGMKRSQGELFRANEIKSIAVNSAQGVLYWVALVNEVAHLYRTDLLTMESVASKAAHKIETLTALPDINLIGPISTFADRLFWLHTEQNQVKISDAHAKTFATLKELKDVHAFDIVDYHQHSLNSTRSVIPEAINPELVEIEGTWENFTLTWQAVTNVNYGQVFYDLMLEDKDRNRTNLVLSETSFNYPNALKPLKPYSSIKVAIRPFTYWASAKQVVLTLHTPSSIPSKPRDIRVFIYVNQSLLTATNQMPKSASSGGYSISAEARWRPPADPNGVILSYTVSLWSVRYDNQAKIESKVIENQLSYKFENLQPNATYYFEVRATTDAGEGAPSEVYQFKTFTDASPSRLLLADSNSILLSDMDLRQNELITKSINPILVDYIYSEDIVFWIEEGNFLKRASISNGTNFTLIAQLHEPTTGLAVDWIGRRLYLSTVDRYHNKSTIWFYDYSNDQAHLHQVTHFFGREVLGLRVNPYSSELIWSEVPTQHHTSPLATLKVCKLAQYGTVCASTRALFSEDRPRVGLKTNCNCTFNTPVGRTFSMDFSGPAVAGQHQGRVVYFDLESRHFASSDMAGCVCRRLSARITGNAPISLTYDSSLYWKNDTSGSIYRTAILGSSYQHPNLSATEHIEYGNTQINSITSYNLHNQPYPDFACLMPHNLGTQVRLVDSGAYSLTLRVESSQELASMDSDCGDVSQASLRYRIRYRKHYDNVQIDCRRADVQQCHSFDSYNNTFHVTDLEPFTNYTFSVELDNYYLAMSRTPMDSLMSAFVPTDEYRFLFNDNFVFSTAESRPGPPRNVRAVVETPDKILILWDQPEKLNSNAITYEVWWYSVELNRKSVFHSNDRTRHGSYFMYLENVKPGKEYNVSVRAYADNHQYMESAPILVRAYEEPSPLIVANLSARSITLKWDSPSQGSVIENHQLLLQEDEPNGSNWTTFVKNATLPNSTYEFRVTNLLPSTKYKFHLSLTYSATKSVYHCPRKLLIVTTTSDVPDTPALHEIMPIKNGNGDRAQIFKVSWDPVKSNSPDEAVYYALYESVLDSDATNSDSTYEDFSENSVQSLALRSESKWHLVYNGTDNYWVVTGLESGRKHLFRLAATNTVGRSNYSSTTSPFYLPFQDQFDLTESNEKMLAFVVSICVIFVGLLIVIAFFSLRRYHIKEKSLVDNSSTSSPSFDLQLVPWGQLPSHPHMPNSLYINSNVENVDLGDTKVIDYKYITKGKILGKGAFGEVFEGILHKNDAKVAIKVLNKGSSDNEQINFLKEAKFMSEFQHPHILQLLGVCLNAEQPIIVMEFMEGGDLLNYLRKNRPSVSAPSPLTMDDMLSICIDVAKGCQYLENIHFVHRDLAARNCLVSSLDRTQRVVKIADFGLTRGLYKQNYYRKEGGLLPVRWMSPESLVDGVFTSQSDVWSFGIIMYEVMIFGEQPYQGLSNEEVLNQVKGGKILGQPTGCPFEIYSLMMRCWSFQKELRPNFAQILAELEAIRQTYQTLKRQHFEQNLRHNPLTSVHNQNYISMLAANGQVSPHRFSMFNPNFTTALNHQSMHLQRQSMPHYHGHHHSLHEELLFPSRLTSATLVLEPSLSRASSHLTNHSQTSTPNLSGPYLNANGRPATIYEQAGHNRPSIVDLDGYQIPIRT